MMDLPSVDHDPKPVYLLNKPSSKNDLDCKLPSLGILKNSSSSIHDLRKQILNKDLP